MRNTVQAVGVAEAVRVVRVAGAAEAARAVRVVRAVGAVQVAGAARVAGAVRVAPVIAAEAAGTEACIRRRLPLPICRRGSSIIMDKQNYI